MSADVTVPRKRVVTLPALPQRATRQQLLVLSIIAKKQAEGERIAAKDLAAQLNVSTNAMQQVLARMERAGLVRRGGWEVA